MAFAAGLRHRLTVADRSLLSGIKVFLFDCDGVVWKGSQAIPGAVDTLNYLKSAGKQVYYVVQLCSGLEL
jgi:singapore isolate B (sub-type 7) whole genome shotgun sequence assembly, scaffold_16